MTIMNQSRKMTDGAMLLAIYALLLLASVFVPGLSILAILLLPVPFAVYTARHSWKPALVMAAAGLMISFVVIPPVSLPLTVCAALGGIMIGAAIYQGAGAYETLARGAAGFVIGFVLIAASIPLFYGVNFVDQINHAFDESLQMTESMLGNLGTAPTAEQKELIRQQTEMIKDLIPASLAIMSLFYAWLVQWISYKLIGRMDKRTLRFPPFRTLQMPVALIFVYLVFIFLGMVDFQKGSMLYLAVHNVLVLLELLILLQGLSFIFYFSYMKKLSKAVPFIVIIAILIFWPFLILVRLLGVLDIGIRLRDRISPKQ